MDISWFVQTLKTGELYTLTNAEGETYEVRHPPTQQGIKAAKIIENMHQQLEHKQETISNLQHQLNTAIQDIDELRNKTV